MTLPSDTRPMGRCPSCHARGVIGEPCAERVCSLKGYGFVPHDGPDDALVDDPLVGQRCGDYLLVGLIGAGGFGRVYEALQLPVRMPAAVKVLDIEGGEAGMAAVKLAKVAVEAQALARLSHPNIVRLYHYGTHRGAPYLAMELVEGAMDLWGEIQARAAIGRDLSLDEVETILMQVLAALEAAHERQIVHRDIKPENIMLQTVPGHGLFVKVLDFGLAKFTEDRAATSILLGTPAYMAYEQLTRGPIGPWTDLYALGVLAFELLTGKRPYGGSDVQETLALKLEPGFDPWSRVARDGFPDALRELVARTLAHDHKARYRNAAELRVGLQKAIAALRAGGERFVRIPVARLVEPTVIPIGPSAADNPVLADTTKRMQRPAAGAAKGQAAVGANGQVEVPRQVPTVRTGTFEAVAVAPGKAKRVAWAIALGAGLVGLGALGIHLAGGATTNERPEDAAATLEGEAVPGQARSSVRVATAPFARGSSPHDPEHREDEALQQVVLSRGLVVSPTEVTQAEWAAIFETRPWTHTGCGPSCPVEGVTWWDAVGYANALSERAGRDKCYRLRGCKGVPGDGDFMCMDARFEGIDCEGWRLPTEAEWEFLARAQRPPAEPDALGEVAWFGVDGPRPVAGKDKNAFGLYDMFGNVREWVHDAYGEYPKKDRVRDPTGVGGEGDRVIRGGGYRSPPAMLRAAARDRAPLSTRAPDLGFRVVRSAPK